MIRILPLTKRLLTMLSCLALVGAWTLAVPGDASAQSDMACQVRADLAPIEGRASPLDSLTFHVDGQDVKVCYGRPSVRGRTMIGSGSSEGPAAMGQVPFGRIWRTGANEVTLLITPIALSVAGIAVPAGTYSIYTIPGETEWEVIVNRAYTQWGMESFYDDDVAAQEVGRGTVPVEETDEHVEMLTFRTEESMGDGVRLLLEWERTRVPIPISAG
jgi:Protein of unknown function (DUF2911)